MSVRGSASWELTIVLVTTFLVGSLLLTIFDPIWQDWFASAFWDTNNSTLQMLLDAIEAAATYTALFILFGIVSRSWVWSRRTG
jgi:hypothetical protein